MDVLSYLLYPQVFLDYQKHLHAVRQHQRHPDAGVLLRPAERRGNHRRNLISALLLMLLLRDPPAHLNQPDAPSTEAILIEERDPHLNALGIKGVGKIGITGIAGAVVNAVRHATGIGVPKIPYHA